VVIACGRDGTVGFARDRREISSTTQYLMVSTFQTVVNSRDQLVISFVPADTRGAESVRAGVRVFGCCMIPAARAQVCDFEKPLQTIDEDISAFAFAPMGASFFRGHNMKQSCTTGAYDSATGGEWQEARLLQETSLNWECAVQLCGGFFSVGRRMERLILRGFRTR